jgi:hypothetical protein
MPDAPTDTAAQFDIKEDTAMPDAPTDTTAQFDIKEDTAMPDATIETTAQFDIKEDTAMPDAPTDTTAQFDIKEDTAMPDATIETLRPRNLPRSAESENTRKRKLREEIEDYRADKRREHDRIYDRHERALNLSREASDAYDKSGEELDIARRDADQKRSLIEERHGPNSETAIEAAAEYQEKQSTYKEVEANTEHRRTARIVTLAIAGALFAVEVVGGLLMAGYNGTAPAQALPVVMMLAFTSALFGHIGGTADRKANGATPEKSDRFLMRLGMVVGTGAAIGMAGFVTDVLSFVFSGLGAFGTEGVLMALYSLADTLFMFLISAAASGAIFVASWECGKRSVDSHRHYGKAVEEERKARVKRDSITAQYNKLRDEWESETRNRQQAAENQARTRRRAMEVAENRWVDAKAAWDEFLEVGAADLCKRLRDRGIEETRAAELATPDSVRCLLRDENGVARFLARMG